MEDTWATYSHRTEPHVKEPGYLNYPREGSCPGERPTHGGRVPLPVSSGPVWLSGFPGLESVGPTKQQMTQPAPLAFRM